MEKDCISIMAQEAINRMCANQRQWPGKARLSQIWALAVLSALLTTAVCGAADTDKHLSEYQVKASYLYNFTKFVDWPPQNYGNSQVFTIVVMGKNPFGEDLNPLTGKLVYNRKVLIRYIRNIEALQECDLLFISADETDNIIDILTVLNRRQGILTVSDVRNFAQKGGIIGFVNKEGRIRFQINKRVARQANLAISSELLKLALMVLE